MDPEEEDPQRSARLRKTLDRAYDPDATDGVDDRMIAAMLQLSSDELPAARVPVALERPGLAARLLRTLRRR